MALDKALKDREYKKFVEDAAGNAAVRVVPTDASGADMLKVEDVAHTTGDPGIQILSVRSDTAASTAGSDGDYAGLITDANGRLHAITVAATGVNVPTVTNATGSGAISTSTTLSAAAKLKSITLLFNTAPTTSEDLTVTLNATDGAAYDAVLRTTDPSVGSKTSVVYDLDIPLENGDEIDVAYTNTDARTYGLRIVTEAM